MKLLLNIDKKLIYVCAKFQIFSCNIKGDMHFLKYTCFPKLDSIFAFPNYGNPHNDVIMQCIMGFQLL